MANKCYCGEKGVVVLHNVAGFIHDRGWKLIQIQIATQKTSGIKLGRQSKASYLKHDNVRTHLVRQWVNWFHYTVAPQMHKPKKPTPAP